MSDKHRETNGFSEPSKGESSESSEKTTSSMSSKETREIVTPHAFYVSDELYGIPLASPSRRGVALLIDMSLVALLAQVNGFVLAAGTAWAFFNAGNRLKAKNKAYGMQFFLRILVALLLFVAVFGLVETISKNRTNHSDLSTEASRELEIEHDFETTGLLLKYLGKRIAIEQRIERDECSSVYQCVETVAAELVADVEDSGVKQKEADDLYFLFVEAVSEELTSAEKIKLQNFFKAAGQGSSSVSTDNNLIDTQDEFSAIKPVGASSDTPNDTSNDILNDHANDDSISNTSDEPEKKAKPEKPTSIIGWAKQLAEDLGLGFGWAAFYFSLFTTWWKGQTPGKKLLGIRVLKLDNKPLTLWDSFGRYGGYGAGVATGLLGFLQVYWDPNRQAIQDKISATLVVNLRLPKVSYNKTPKR